MTGGPSSGAGGCPVQAPLRREVRRLPRRKSVYSCSIRGRNLPRGLRRIQQTRQMHFITFSLT